ncbi:MAG: RNA polymerase sigma factor [Candidatus Eisenbacteria bacterium]|nr:RNA polymerase sigma factor [Candidatus Eisenbacteria bacterium]
MQQAVNSEWECLIRAQRGDETASRVLIGRYQARLLALALFITGSVAAADDVVQETFVRALRTKIKHRTGTVQALLSTIAYRLALKEANRLRRNVALDKLDLLDRDRNALESVLSDELDRLVAETIGALNAEHRDVLVLRFYGGHSYEEIADILQTSLGTVKSRIFYAVKSCRETLRRKGVLE